MEISGKRYAGVHVDHQPNQAEGVLFSNCVFVGCTLAGLRDARRFAVRGIRLSRCKSQGSVVGPVFLEDCEVNGLETVGHDLTFHDTAFRHVSLLGDIGHVQIRTRLAAVSTPARWSRISAENTAYYESVDWALDISRARFKDCEIEGVPCRLIRRDSESQVVISRKSLAASRWRKVAFGQTHYSLAIEGFLASGDEDRILVAPRRDRRFPELVRVLEDLRRCKAAD